MDYFLFVYFGSFDLIVLAWDRRTSVGSQVGQDVGDSSYDGP